MSEAIDLGSVQKGFAHPALDAQRIYRRVLDAISFPGRVQDMSESPEPPEGMSRAAAGYALTLFDFETLVWLDPALRAGPVEAWLRFHCGCPLTEDMQAAAFALIANPSTMPRLDEFNTGDARYPDRSTTLIVQVPDLVNGERVELEGPGIPDRIAVAPAGLPADFWTQVAENGSEFQLGVDVFVVDEENILGLPRTVRVLRQPNDVSER